MKKRRVIRFAFQRERERERERERREEYKEEIRTRSPPGVVCWGVPVVVVVVVVAFGMFWFRRSESHRVCGVCIIKYKCVDRRKKTKKKHGSDFKRKRVFFDDDDDSTNDQTTFLSVCPKKRTFSFFFFFQKLLFSWITLSRKKKKIRFKGSLHNIQNALYDRDER